MRFYLRNLILFASFFNIEMATYADPPEAITKRILEQRDAFMNVLPGLTKNQHHLLLQRYADLLPRSRTFSRMKIDKRDLEEYLNKTFPTPDDKPKSHSDYSLKDQEIDALIKRLKSDRKGYFESQKKLQLHFECSGVQYLFPFEILSLPESGFLELQLRGIRIPNPDKDPGNCLRVKMNLDDSTMEIPWLSSRSYACPIPAVRGGECMLNVAEQIAWVLGAHTLLLDDSAKAECSLNGAEVGLTLLRSFQKGKGWYESQGFRPRSNAEDAKVKKERLLEYTLDSLEHSLEAQKHKLDSAIQQLLEKRLPEYRKEEDGKTVARFMKWLWDRDCSDYVKLDDFFRSDEALEFSKLYRSPGKLIKRLQPLLK